MATPHGIAVDRQGNVWVTDFAGNKNGTKGHQVHKFSPKGEKLMSLGIAGKPGNADGQFNQPNAVVVGPDGSIYVADGHDAQGMITAKAVAEGIARGATSRISKFSPDGKFIKSWGKIGLRHGEFRTPHALKFDSMGRLWVADRGNHRIEIFDQNGTYLESRYMFSRPSGIFIQGETVYVIDSESGPYNHPNWRDGVRIGLVGEDQVTGFIPPFDREDRVYQGTMGEGVPWMPMAMSTRPKGRIPFHRRAGRSPNTRSGVSALASLLLKPAKTASTNSSTADFCGNPDLRMINRGLGRRSLGNAACTFERIVGHSSRGRIRSLRRPDLGSNGIVARDPAQPSFKLRVQNYRC
jgi:hypothetical protein